MHYTLLLRALVNIKQKEKAEEHLARLFPGIAARVDGRYWKDQSLWEANLRLAFDYSDDHAALWETLSYLRRAIANWVITSGPNDASSDEVVTGIFEQRDEPGLVWCSFQLLREGALDPPASGIDV